jgi:cytochrome c oxidase subunit 1
MTDSTASSKAESAGVRSAAVELYTDPRGFGATIWSWITTVDHKRIGIMYGAAALFFLLIGGVEALVMRIQLAVPQNDFVDAETFNQMFTMHGTTMIFLVAMPMAVAFFNYIVPLQIGARDVAFPRLNALSFWVFMFGGLYLNSSFLFNAAPNASWVGYANLTSTQFSPGPNVDFWVIGLSIVGVSSLIGAINFITTIINLRAPSLTLMRLPLFTWMTFVTSWILVTAIPVIAVALIFLAADRFFATNFFVPTAGGDPVLWQHLFWIFGHPEVYILVLPSFGIMSEVVATFSRKPLFGYPIVVYAGILIGFIGWGVWSHHMFTTGLGPIADSFFVASTMIIAIPTGVKIFNWLATMWGGSISFTSAMLFGIGLLAIFTIGGLSGIMHASAPVDLQQHDSYFVVAHFHYTIVGGAMTGLFAGFYLWFPKVTGRLMSETLGKLHFWTFIIGFNLTFFPMHFAGLFGMPRRVFTYPAELNVAGYNMASTIGAFIFGLSSLIFLWNLWRSAFRGAPAGTNPWNAGTLEWATSSPPPHYNFAEIPEVKSRDPLWSSKFRVETKPLSHDEEPIMPSPSFWPILTAFGISLTWILVMTRIWWVPLIGLAVTAICVYSWAFQPEFRQARQEQG